MNIFSKNLLNGGGNQVISSDLSAPVTNSFSNIEHLTNIDNSYTTIKFLASGSSGVFSSDNGKNYTKLFNAPSNMGSYSVLFPAYTNMNYNIGILFYLDMTQRQTRVAGFSQDGVINNAIYFNYAMNPRDCIYHNNKYYLVGEDSYIADTANGYLFIGDNVQSWNDPVILPNQYQPKYIVYGNDIFVISDGGSCIYSADGYNYSQPVELPTSSIGWILYDKGYFYILGYDGIYRSKNLYSWIKLYNGNYNSSKGCFGTAKLAVLKQSGLVVSPTLELVTSLNYVDFKNIEVSSAASGNNYNAIAYGNNMFSIIGGNKAYNMLWGIEE